MKDFDLNELHTNYPEAYNALPDSYKNDSCLTFFIDVNNNLCAEDDSGKEYQYINGYKNNFASKWIQIA
jgi:hypothetical protein